MMTRRTLFGAAAAAAALPQFSFGATTPAVHSEDLKLGVATYSLRKFNRQQAIQMIKDLGVKYVSIKDFHLSMKDTPEQIQAAVKEFRDAGFIVHSGGNINLQKNEEPFLRSMFEYAKNAGFQHIVCAPTHETLPTVEKLVKEYNIKAAIHPHGPEDKHFPNGKSVLDAVAKMDKRMGMCYDIGHSARTGEDIVEMTGIALKTGRLFDFHIKDLKILQDDGDGKKARDSQVDVGEGSMPIVALFKTLKKGGYQGPVSLEYEINADNPMMGMAKSYSYMKGVLSGLRS